MLFQSSLEQLSYLKLASFITFSSLENPTQSCENTCSSEIHRLYFPHLQMKVGKRSCHAKM